MCKVRCCNCNGPLWNGNQNISFRWSGYGPKPNFKSLDDLIAAGNYVKVFHTFCPVKKSKKKVREECKRRIEKRERREKKKNIPSK